MSVMLRTMGPVSNVVAAMRDKDQQEAGHLIPWLSEQDMGTYPAKVLVKPLGEDSLLVVD